MVTEEPIEEIAGIIVPLVRKLICDSVVGDSKALQHSFNNFKQFQNIQTLDELYKVFNTNGPVLYDLKKTVKLIFKTLGGGTVEGVLQTIYVSFIFVNLISIGQLRKDGIEYNKYKDCFVAKIGQDVVVIIWIVNVFILSV